MPKPLKDGRLRTPTQAVLAWICGPGRRMATTAATRAAHQIRRNLTSRRLLSFPHFLFLIWVVILLWGERWVFETKVQKCDWKHWETWPKEANPHHLVFVADPQIIDPHSYPGRPWPLNPLTVLVTDNYLRRGYRAVQRHLHPDSVFFLGDLFDGGREWRTRHGTQFVDPKWGGGRSDTEKKWVKTWHRKYGEDFWIREYRRFSDIFFKPFNEAGGVPGSYQRGRKLVASLPGNHDLGFGAQVQVPVRDRFSAYFGDTNRIDVVGNHTIVSVDTVSLSADTSLYKDSHDLRPIYGPVHEFLDQVQANKRKAAQEELTVWHGVDRGLKLQHRVEDVNNADLTRSPRDPGPGAADLPTILLTHVPLFRPPGTPCGLHREHWPPSKATLRKDGTVDPTVRDERNAISVSAGYQYQNVLSEDDSVNLVKKVSNVIHVFSGDDHDYCELVHSPAKGYVREITVKSFSMAMGVPTPGFLMVSLYNPIDANGAPIPGSPEKTLQTHLCLLPNQFHTYMKYVIFTIVSLVLLCARAFLLPVFHLTPFALEPETPRTSVLPIYKDKAKVEPPESAPLRSSAGATSGLRGQSITTNGSSPRWSSKKSRSSQQWGWADENSGPRIKLDNHFYNSKKSWQSGKARGGLHLLVREWWTTTWRLTWLTVLYWAYLARKG
ncbi:hypothetical protein QQS21_010969 [Conoideocrella luteorostrata]|uniref:Calcineurin-like phosphoesterase domain-containing protein n=1 Tax=Conoideocrella luteorostrata TaxID=1105319 RepID=A0AAJ0FTQ6_9HYPO|nr:hypothetical protein QQS21_010969 [Conoideocrella luteorostrata]